MRRDESNQSPLAAFVVGLSPMALMAFGVTAVRLDPSLGLFLGMALIFGAAFVYLVVRVVNHRIGRRPPDPP